MATFDGATFDIISPSLSRETAADVSVRHLPTTDHSYVDIGGRLAETLSMEVFLDTDAEAVALRAKVGVEGSLVYPDGTVTAVLISMRRGTRYEDGSQAASLELVVTG